MQTCFNKMQAYKELVKMQEINIQRVMSNLEEIYQCGKKENGELLLFDKYAYLCDVVVTLNC